MTVEKLPPCITDPKYDCIPGCRAWNGRRPAENAMASIRELRKRAKTDPEARAQLSYLGIEGEMRLGKRVTECPPFMADEEMGFRIARGKSTS